MPPQSCCSGTEWARTSQVSTRRSWLRLVSASGLRTTRIRKLSNWRSCCSSVEPIHFCPSPHTFKKKAGRARDYVASDNCIEKVSVVPTLLKMHKEATLTLHFLDYDDNWTALMIHSHAMPPPTHRGPAVVSRCAARHSWGVRGACVGGCMGVVCRIGCSITKGGL